MTLNHGLFALMALIWGLTWIAIKAGISAVPPAFFAAARYLLVALVLAIAVKGSWSAFQGGRAPRVVATGALNNVATYALLFWGMQYVPSGVAGLVNLALMPVSLYGLAILFGDERATWRHAAALALGMVGLVALFWDKTSSAAGQVEAAGLVAVVAATFSYALGSVLSRPLLHKVTPLELTGAHAIVGAVGLMAVSLAFEPISGAQLLSLLSPAPLLGLAFLVVFGTFVAYTVYLRLVHAWGAPRAGLFAFVSPVVALIAGTLVFAEPLGAREAIGAAAMLAGAGLAMPGQGLGRSLPASRQQSHLGERPS
jgi:drug/metabolite transporter (DMT)-like permease